MKFFNKHYNLNTYGRAKFLKIDKLYNYSAIEKKIF